MKELFIYFNRNDTWQEEINRGTLVKFKMELPDHGSVTVTARTKRQ